MTRQLTGRHVLMIAIGAFAVILTANLTMMFAATGTFPGLIVKNSFVASQGWNDRTAAQQALGWTGAAGYSDGILTISIDDEAGEMVRGLTVSATVGRPVADETDRDVTFAEGVATYEAPGMLAPGAWRVAFTATDEAGRSYTATANLVVAEPGT